MLPTRKLSLKVTNSLVFLLPPGFCYLSLYKQLLELCIWSSVLEWQPSFSPSKVWQQTKQAMLLARKDWLWKSFYNKLLTTIQKFARVCFSSTSHLLTLSFYGWAGELPFTLEVMLPISESNHIIIIVKKLCNQPWNWKEQFHFKAHQVVSCSTSYMTLKLIFCHWISFFLWEEFLD